MDKSRDRHQWEIFFDFEDFRVFKSNNPEFLDWLDKPDIYISEFLKEQQNNDIGRKISWEIFEAYHNESISFIEHT